jgi:hypothetical protein
MRFSRQRTRSIQALPSIYTAFPIIYEQISSTSTNESPDTFIAEGIEVVPLERSNTTCAKIVSPGTEEKETVSKTPLQLHIATKPLPGLPRPRQKPTPRRRWDRMPVKRRIVILVGIQMILVIALLGGLMCIRGNPLDRCVNLQNEYFTLTVHIRGQGREVQSADVDSPPAPGSPSIKRGVYNLPLGNARLQSSACLAMNNESVAWACTDGGTLRVDVSASASGQVPKTLISLGVLAGSSQAIYGQRPPEIPLTDVFLSEDAGESNGPLYSFKTTYNRTVLLHEGQLPQTGQSSNLSASVEGTVIGPEDRLWLCFFNETTVEGYLYAPRTSTLAAPGNASGTSQPPRFPYILKLVEQRFPNGTRPYCERKKMPGNGQLIPDGTSKQWLSLSEPAFLPAKVRRDTIFSTRHKRQETPSTNSCRCEWVCEHSG